MDMNKLKRLPVGIQTFSEVINLDCLYIDKTEYIWNMVHLSKYIFLSRPRRFGKSLLVSRSRPISRERGNCSRAWPWNGWRRNGWNILCCVST